MRQPSTSAMMRSKRGGGDVGEGWQGDGEGIDDGRGRRVFRLHCARPCGWVGLEEVTMLEAEMTGTADAATAEERAEPGVPDAREALLARVANEKIRRQIAELHCVEAYDWAGLFPRTEGMGAAADVKRRVTILKGVEARLERLLYPGERIEFVTSGMLNSFVEQYFLGIWSMLINQTVFLFTNYRVILLNSDMKKRAKVLMWQVPYHRLGTYGAGSFVGSMRLKLSGGKSFSFGGVPGRDRKRLKEYMSARLAEARRAGDAFPCHADRDPLCPRCCSPVQADSAACAECGELFIKPWTPALMSLVIPGLGNLYLGNTAIGIMELLGFLGVLLVALSLAIGSPFPLGIFLGLGVIALGHALDASVTHHIASKGKLPTRLAWRG